MTQSAPQPRVALLLIGNELLSGKIRDMNGYLLAQKCTEWGAELINIQVVPDDVSTIADTINRMRKSVDILITSGGVGPTHDDVTYEAVALAFGCEQEQHRELSIRLRSYFGERLTAEHLKMAHLPVLAQSITTRDAKWPLVHVDNVFILPGVPQIFELKLEMLKSRLSGRKRHLATLELRADEGSIAKTLEETEKQHDVLIGSYPFSRANERWVRITIESFDRSLVAFLERSLTATFSERVESN